MKKLVIAWLDGGRVLGRIIWFSVVASAMLFPLNIGMLYIQDEVYSKHPPLIIVIAGIGCYIVLLPFILHLAAGWSKEFRKPTTQENNSET